MSTILPTDVNDNVIPALRLKNGAAHSISSSIISARNANAFDAETRVVSLYASEPIYVVFGDVSAVATASDHYFPAGVYYTFAIGGEGSAHSKYVAVLSAGVDGSVYISEME